MAPQHQAPKGTLDILPPGDGGAPFDSARFALLVERYSAWMSRAGFGLVVGPAFEDLAVYARVGATTDIVGKEMYDFHDKGGRHLALRPDSTPSVVRAFVEHRPVTPWKVWYLAPHFRYDQPQAGRYRQHHSLGVEVLGVEDPDLDAELVGLSAGFLAELGLDRVELLVNSIGDEACRPEYRQRLMAFFDQRQEKLCAEHRTRYRENPMRILDCKRDECRVVTEEAPRMLDHLCSGCAAHFDRVRSGLSAQGIDYVIDTRLVRGQDYYTRTTFELVSRALSSAQLAVGGGGRYDGFVEALGGPPTPGIGFGLGVERILLAADAEGVLPAPATRLDVFVVDTTSGEAAREQVVRLRAAGIRADRAYDQRSFKAQMKQALRSTATFALVVEETGWTIRTLKEKGEPVPVEPATALEALRERLRP
ncbi:MAG: histidine--tRNA ligase [Actinobacteria bacterium]|nr:histidine--tRNA ligase [Actinomycetota bacterium]MBW3649536.1 histidine--tRNA ligase [Actinomycetota bacterium]